MSVEAVAPSGEGPGPGDGTAADFCHIGDGNRRSNKLIMKHSVSPVAVDKL